MKTLPSAKQFSSPNHGGALVNPRFIVVHFTAGSSLDSSTSWLCNPASKASAHLVIGRDGSLNQLVPLDVVAWHAGLSSWKGLTGLNRFSIGIELDNMGPLQLVNGKFVSTSNNKVVPDSDVFHGKQQGSAYEYWHKYADEQISALKDTVTVLRAAFQSVEDVIGHSDIAPLRKSDPGPALAEVMSALRSPRN